MRVLTDWWLTPRRVAIHLPTRTAVVADLHLGYGQARRQGGEAVPLGMLEQQLADLHQALAGQGVRRLVVAGDLLEDGRVGGVLDEWDDWLGRHEVEWVGLVPGNHDRKLNPGGKLSLFPDGLDLGRWRVVHGDGALPPGPFVQGHEHPWIRVPGVAGAPCYLVGPGRLVLPAYSCDAAGVNVLADPRWQAYRCLALAADRVLDFGDLATLQEKVRHFPREAGIGR